MCVVCSATVAPRTASVCGSSGPWPETKTKSPARSAGEYPPVPAEARSVLMAVGRLMRALLGQAPGDTSSASHLDPLHGVPPEVNEHSVQSSRVVRRAGVDARGSADLGDALRLVDVAVETEQRLVAFDRFADGSRPHGGDDGCAALVARTELIVEFGSGVEVGCVWGHVEVEDGTAHIRQLLGEGVDPRSELFFSDSSRGLFQGVGFASETESMK